MTRLVSGSDIEVGNIIRLSESFAFADCVVLSVRKDSITEENTAEVFRPYVKTEKLVTGRHIPFIGVETFSICLDNRDYEVRL